MKTISFSDVDEAELLSSLARPNIEYSTILDQIQPIIDDVREHGDEAVEKWTEKFDNVTVDQTCIPVPHPDTIELPKKVKKAFDNAYRNIYNFHIAQKPADLKVRTMEGIVCERISRPIERVGLYVPGGTAVLPSTTLMLGVPAQIAGCSTIVLTTPPNKEGGVHPEVLYTAGLIGATHIVLAGGAQAVAAMAYGTESVPKVDKILGPGNQYVTAAKMYLQNTNAQISIDMPAGPSEVLVIADESSNPAFVAADLLSQAEHGVDSQVVLVSVDGFDLKNLHEEIDQQLEKLSRRDIAKNALENSVIVKVHSVDEAVIVSNLYAPEHLIIQTKKPRKLLENVTNAGSVFLGKWTPESLGDYASGTNHTLPTYGYARMYSGVSLQSYLKFITVQKADKDGILKLGPTVQTMADVEGLDAHKNAVTIRLEALKMNKS